MAIIYQATEVPVHEREAVLRSAFDGQSWPTTVDLGNADSADHYMHAWEFGPTSIFQADLTDLRLGRSHKQIRVGPSEMLTIARQQNSVGKHDQFDDRRTVDTGQLMIVDMNEPYQFSYDGRGASQAFYLPLEQMNLPRTVVKEAAARLPASPLYSLFSSHISELTNIGDAIAGTDAASAVGESSIDLARTLIASAYDPDYARNMMAEVLLPRIRGYIRQHLCDPNLSADTIAHAHNISTRKLFRLCEDADFSLEQWIITNRLQGTHDELARPETRALSIAVIARRWGFGNPSYFARRFRTMYGLSPRAWRDLAATQAPPHV